MDSDFNAFNNYSAALNDEDYKHIINEVDDYAFIILDLKGVITFWNKGAEKLKGYSAAEVLGKNYRIFYSAEDKDQLVPEFQLREALKKGKTNYEGWRIRKDGTRFWGSITLSVIRNESGEVRAFFKVTRDLTEKKIAEDRFSNYIEELKLKNEELKKSEDRYHKMVSEVVDYAIILLDKDGKILDWNKGSERLKGYSKDEIMGKTFRLFYPKEDRKNKLPETLLDIAIKAGRSSHEGWRVRKDGSTFWGYVVITALHNQSGEIIGFSKVTRDLTEKKMADEALEASSAQLQLKNKMLERLNNELSAFAFVASHDLKEPLRKIQSYAIHMSKQETFPVSGQAYLQKIKNTTARMQNLIDDLLSYSHISNDKTKFETVDLNEIIEGVKNDLEFMIVEKNAMIESDVLPVLQGVRFQFQQLFLNLLSNSLKFSKRSGAPMITIKAQIINGPPLSTEIPLNSNKYHQITITDNGIGFNPSFSSKIFEAFERLHPKQEFMGTGLGLAIVKRAMQNHNGIVTAYGQPNIGSVFNLYFPYANPKA